LTNYLPENYESFFARKENDERQTQPLSDFYPPILHPETRKPTRREHLKLFIYEKPKTDLERDHNKETKIPGETPRSKRQLEIQSGYYGFPGLSYKKLNNCNVRIRLSKLSAKSSN